MIEIMGSISSAGAKDFSSVPCDRGKFAFKDYYPREFLLDFQLLIHALLFKSNISKHFLFVSYSLSTRSER